MENKTTDEKRLDEFLEEYAALCAKHKIYISGCGCCGSPYPDDGVPDIEHLRDQSYMIGGFKII